MPKCEFQCQNRKLKILGIFFPVRFRARFTSFNPRARLDCFCLSPYHQLSTLDDNCSPFFSSNPI